MVWKVPSLVAKAICMAIIGILMGPMFPILMNQANKVLPPWLVTSSIGWIAAGGATGAALVPFITGAIASRFGIASMHPVVLLMMTFTILMWALIPSQKWNKEQNDGGHSHA